MNITTINRAGQPSIVVQVAGEGQPVLFVHGGFVDSANWSRMVPLLAPKYTLWLMDRRGHGQSDDYRHGDTLLDEADDVLAVLEAIGKPAFLVGHSSGAHVALQAAKRARNAARLVLYEPPVLNNDTSPTPPVSILANRKALAIFALRDVVAKANSEKILTDEAYDAILQSSFGKMLMDNAHSIPAELAAYRAYRFDAAVFATMQMPTLLLVGDKSLPFSRIITDQLHAVLPNSEVVVLEGQGHGAMMSAPHLFADALQDFFGQNKQNGGE